MVLETEAVRRLCAMAPDSNQGGAGPPWPRSGFVPVEARLPDMARVGELDEAFHCTLVRPLATREVAPGLRRDVSGTHPADLGGWISPSRRAWMPSYEEAARAQSSRRARPSVG